MAETGPFEGLEIWRGSAASWECDAMGHLNIGFYVAKASEALVGLAAEMGMPRAFTAEAETTLLVRQHHIRFMREARPAAPLTITGGVLEIGETCATLQMVMRHYDGAIAAAFRTEADHVTSRGACPILWPEHVRDRMAGLRMSPPINAAPRSIDPGPVEAAASLARAEALKLRRIMLGAVRSSDCDAFGRARPEMMMMRLSDGAPHNFGRERLEPRSDGPRIGGAALEHRLIYLRHPTVGDRLDMRSGLASVDSRSRRTVTWMLDPRSGEPWGVAEAVAVSLNLDTRKIWLLDDSALAEARTKVVEGLTL